MACPDCHGTKVMPSSRLTLSVYCYLLIILWLIVCCVVSAQFQLRWRMSTCIVHQVNNQLHLNTGTSAVVTGCVSGPSCMTVTLRRG